MATRTRTDTPAEARRAARALLDAADSLALARRAAQDTDWLRAHEAAGDAVAALERARAAWRALDETIPPDA